MANWSNPVNTTPYLDVLNILKARDVDALTLLQNAAGASNIPNRAIRFLRGASNSITIQERISGSWVNKTLAAASSGTPGNLGSMAQQNANAVAITGGSVAASVLTGTIASARIPNLATSKITSGVFSGNRIPNLDASKINSGTFGAARIPNLAASKITSGKVAIARLPIWTGTQTQYDALTPANGTLYFTRPA